MKNTNHPLDMAQMRKNARHAEFLLKQLANANRLRILCLLLTGEKTVGEMADSIDLSQSALSQHLARLREARMVESQKRGQMSYYRICSREAQAILSVLHLIYCKPS